MAEIQKGISFSPGDLVEAADLNNLVDAATALKGIVMDQPSTAPVQADDSVVFYDLSADNLARCKISALPNGVTSIGMTVDPTSVFVSPGTPNPIVTTGTFTVGLKPQTGNKVLVAPADGTSNIPSFRKLVTADMTVPTVAIAAVDIDWSLGNVFQKPLTTNTTFTFSNVKDGQTIRLRVLQDATGNKTVAWNPTPYDIVWRDGITPAITHTPNDYSIFVFTAIKSASTGLTKIHGYLDSLANVTFGTQAANEFFAGPDSGAAATPAFRAIVPADTISFSEVVSPGNIIDCTVANVFRKELVGTAGTGTLHLKNGALGQKISVYVIQSGPPGVTAVAWTTDDTSGFIRWPSGVDHTMSTGAEGVTDIVNFLCMGSGLYYGTYNKDFVP